MTSIEIQRRWRENGQGRRTRPLFLFFGGGNTGVVIVVFVAAGRIASCEMNVTRSEASAEAAAC